MPSATIASAQGDLRFDIPAFESLRDDAKVKGATRGDQSPEHTLVEPIARALCSTGHPALRRVEIEVNRGTVVLWGCVPTYYLKQLAQSVVQQLAGVRSVANGLEVICTRPRVK